MDSLLLVGNTDEKLGKALGKLGYSVKDNAGPEGIVETVANDFIDIIVLDSRAKIDCINLCQLLRKEEATKKIPIVMVAKSADEAKLVNGLGLDRLELVQAPYSLGEILSRIATQIRLRKLIGASTNNKATLAEVNASLRDINGKLKKDLEDAKKIQQGLLPKKLPQVAGVEMATHYIPLEEVGGDWYFIEKKPSGKIFAFIADVTGHGLPAAFIGSMTKLAYRASNEEDPAACLGQMNRLIAPELPPGKFVTMCAFLYDPVTHKLTFSRAAHPPGFWVNREKNTVTLLETDGYAIGFFEDAEFKNVEIELGLNDTVLMLTDGIVEAQNRDRVMYGNLRVSNALLQAGPEMPAAETITKLMQDFDNFRDGRICKDDITLVVLKRIQ